ncbi:MAG: response regulator [Desulfobacterales bacterium]|nr:response regulator [Desulfobacterales bacterium]
MLAEGVAAGLVHGRGPHIIALLRRGTLNEAPKSCACWEWRTSWPASALKSGRNVPVLRRAPASGQPPGLTSPGHSRRIIGHVRHGRKEDPHRRLRRPQPGKALQAAENEQVSCRQSVRRQGRLRRLYHREARPRRPRGHAAQDTRLRPLPEDLPGIQGRSPIIVITGLYKGPKYRQEALNGLGASDYFEKPLDPAAFLAAVKRLLHDEDDFEDELPDSNSVIEALSRRGRGPASSKGDGKPAQKG